MFEHQKNVTRVNETLIVSCIQAEYVEKLSPSREKKKTSQSHVKYFTLHLRKHPAFYKLQENKYVLQNFCHKRTQRQHERATDLTDNIRKITFLLINTVRQLFPRLIITSRLIDSWIIFHRSSTCSSDSRCLFSALLCAGNVT